MALSPQVARAGNWGRSTPSFRRAVWSRRERACLAAFAVVLVSGGSAAYAVDKQSDGTVTVTVKSLKDAAGLQRALIAAGIPAVVTYTPTGKTCAPDGSRRLPKAPRGAAAGR